MMREITSRMAEKLGKYTAIDISRPDQTDNIQLALSLRNKDEMRKFEEKEEEDCYILDFDDPNDELNFSKLSVSDHSIADVQFIAQNGQIAFRDFPHPWHSCATFPFRVTPHESHCEQCYCYVCDLPAPCKKWVGGKTSHCHAFDNEKWSTMRKSIRQTNALQIKLCNCYVCEEPAPCQEWIANSIYAHCHAFSNGNWRTEREQSRKLKAYRKVVKETRIRNSFYFRKSFMNKKVS